jgi:hypothetical protein
MSDDELNALFASLSDVLARAGLAWVVEQVNAAITQGMPVEREARTGVVRRPDMFSEVPERSARDVVRSSEPYPPRERLLKLLDALETALAHRGQLAERLVGFFAGEGRSGGMAIVFVAEDPRGGEPTEAGVDVGDARALARLLGHVVELRDLIQPSGGGLPVVPRPIGGAG